jgi:hypothetical protein
MDKVENLTAELTRKERDITTLETNKESFLYQLSQKEKQITDLRQEHMTEKNTGNDKIESLRQK